MSFFRFIKIIFVIVRYRLDEFFNSKLIFLIQIFLSPLRLFQDKKLGRAIRLRLALEQLGPIFVKFGQMLSTRRDLIPVDIANELAKLQDQVPPFSFSEAKILLEKSYSKPINKIFKEFSENPIASASVAQVHFAELLNEKKVAVKILRPNIQKKVDSNQKFVVGAGAVLATLVTIMQVVPPVVRVLTPQVSSATISAVVMPISEFS